MERLIRIGLVLLVLSLALNIALLSRVNRIENLVNGRLMGDGVLQNIMSLTQQNTDRINQAINTIETEQRWVTPVEFAGTKQEGGSLVTKLAWVIKDYPGGAPVTFHYRKPGDKEFISRQAASVGDGRFEVELTDNLKSEPLWKIQTIYTEGNSGDSKSNRVSEVAGTVDQKQYIDYYITVKDGTHMKSSEITSLDTEILSLGIYAPLSAEIQADRERERYSVFLTQSVIEPKQAKLSQAILEAYQGDKLISQNKLTEDEHKPDNSVRLFTTEWNYKGTTFDRVFLRVEYENGKQFKKEIKGMP